MWAAMGHTVGLSEYGGAVVCAIGNYIMT